MEFCKHCLFGKQKRVSFLAAMHRTKLKLDYMHSDLWDPLRVFSKRDSRYMLTIINDYARKVWLFFLKRRDEVFGEFKE